MLDNQVFASVERSSLHKLTNRITEQFFGCTHANLSWPRTIRANGETAKRTYTVCLNCGSELPFDADRWQRI